MATSLVVSIISISAVSAADYFVDIGPIDNSNVYGKVGTPYVNDLGIAKNVQECAQLCATNITTPYNDRCQSFTWFDATYYVDPMRKHCYGVMGKQYGSVWTYVSDKGGQVGRIIYECMDNTDCSLNGKCDQTTGNCTCNPGWTGYHCGLINFDKATKTAGYYYPNNVSSWGGAVLIDDTDTNDDTKYHMYLAEFDNHCGVNAWVPNSKVVHAQSTKGYNSKYVAVDTIHPHFAHEPDAIRGPNGEYVLYYIAGNVTSGKECVCRDGSTPNNCDPGTVPQPFTVLMQYSSSVNGPWSDPVQVIKHETSPCDDPNLAGVILENGTFIGLVRNWVAGFSTVYPIRSDDWKDAAKYKIDMKTNVFPQLEGGGTEDQFLYRDCDGGFHAIWNNQSPKGDVNLCGGHSYSVDGINWVYTGFAFGPNVTWTDGSTTTFLRRERPHFIFGDDKCTPIALTNAVDYGGTNGDASYAFVHKLMA